MTKDGRNVARTEPGPSPKLLTVTQVAELLCISRRQIYRLKAMGAIRCVKLGRACRIQAESVDLLIKRGGTQ